MSAIGGNGPTIGTISDIVNRIRATLAPWFPDLPSAPVLNAVLTSQADQFAFVYQYLQFAANQTRIKTATGGWLDLIAWDYFGARFARKISLTTTTRTNLLLQSDAFNVSPWVPFNVSLTAGASLDPSGTNNGWLLFETAAVAVEHTLAQIPTRLPPAPTYTRPVHVKARPAHTSF